MVLLLSPLSKAFVLDPEIREAVSKKEGPERTAILNFLQAYDDTFGYGDVRTMLVADLRKFLETYPCDR